MIVYISAPYSASPQECVSRVIDVANQLIINGYTPLVPHLYHFIDQVHGHDYDTWMTMCLNLVMVSDAVLRLSGESKGADRETELAKHMEIPVYETIGELYLRESEI